MSLRYPGFSFFRRGVPCMRFSGRQSRNHQKAAERLPCVQVAWTTEVVVVAYYPKG